MQDALFHLPLPRNEAVAAPLGAPRTFIVGPENRLLAPAVQRLLDGDDLAAAATLFNPLAIVGPEGSGKSHIAQGLVRHWRRRLPADEIAYFTAADMTRECQSAHGEERIAAWRRDLARLRLLVVEGLERLRRGAAVGRELRLAIDDILNAGGMVVVTADREPASLANLDAALRDRLAAGLAIRVAHPGMDARRALLTEAAASRGLSLSDEQLDALARTETGSAGQLLQRLGSAADNASPAAAPAPAAPVDGACAMKQILAVAARYFGVTQAALVGPSRRKSLVAARNTVVYLARRLTPLSYAEIGRALGERDHTTIMHANQRLAESLNHDRAAQQAVDELERILRC